ncbi:hypothetical protein D3C87_587880 [compost metagenome]
MTFRQPVNSPPDLEEIIRRGQAKALKADGGVFEGKPMNLSSDVARVIFGMGMILLAGSIFAATYTISSKIDKVEVLIERGVTVMDKLPAATDRMEKLLDRVDLSVQHGVSGLKEAAPAVTEGWINGIRNGLSKETK